MSLALATRGYLCPGRALPSVPFGPGPDIVGIVEQKPSMLGAGLIQEEGPSISGAAIQAPQISTSAASQSPAAGETPTIVGGELQVPNIDGSEED